MARKNTVGEMVSEMGLTWAEWMEMPKSERYYRTAVHSGDSTATLEQFRWVDGTPAEIFAAMNGI